MAWDNLLDKYQVQKQPRKSQDQKLRSSYNIQKSFNDTRKNKVFERIYTSLKEDEDMINKSSTFISEKLSQISNSSPQKTLNMSEFSQKSAQKNSGFSQRQYNRSKTKNQEAIKEAEKDGYIQTNTDNIYISDQQFENTSQNKSELSQNNQNQLRFFSKMFISQSMGMSYENIDAINQKQDQLFQSYLKSSTITDQDVQKSQLQNQIQQNNNNSNNNNNNFDNIKYNFGSSNQVLNTNMSIEEEDQFENESGKQLQNIENYLESTNKVYFVNKKKNNISHLEKTANF